MLLMTVVPAVELYLLIKLGTVLGALETALIIVLTGAIGATLAKREGLGVLASLKEEAKLGIPPAERLIEGVLVLVGGVLLITPGVLTDLTGFALIIPWTRRGMVPIVKRQVAKRFNLGGSRDPTDGPEVKAPRPAASRRSAQPADPRFDHPEG